MYMATCRPGNDLLRTTPRLLTWGDWGATNWKWNIVNFRQCKFDIKKEFNFSSIKFKEVWNEPAFNFSLMVVEDGGWKGSVWFAGGPVDLGFIQDYMNESTKHTHTSRDIKLSYSRKNNIILPSYQKHCWGSKWSFIYFIAIDSLVLFSIYLPLL